MAGHDPDSSGDSTCHYPLNVPRSEIDADDLRRYSLELERKSGKLFVQESAKCSVELWQVANLEGRRAETPNSRYETTSMPHAEVSAANGVSQKSPSVSWVSSLQGLQSSWKVRESSSARVYETE